MKYSDESSSLHKGLTISNGINLISDAGLRSKIKLQVFVI